MTRRDLLALAAAPFARAQMASRGVRPTPAGKRSGLPFSKLVNVAPAAGLRAPVLYGPVGHTDFAIEAMGCGAAFFDFDNDGWLDVFLPPRLYRNNRNGTFTDVTAKSGSGRSGWACRRDRRRLRQRRLRRSLHHLLGRKLSVPQQRRRNLHRCHRKRLACSDGRHYAHRVHVGGLRPRRPARPLRRALPGSFDPAKRRRAQRRGVQLEGRSRLLRPRAACRTRSAASIATTATARSPTSREAPASPTSNGGYGTDRRRGRLRRRRLARHLRRLRLHARACCSATTATARSPRMALKPASP